MKKSLLDTDIISYYFRSDPCVQKKIEAYTKEHAKITISRVTVYEIEGGLKAKKAARQLSDFVQFVSQHEVLEITETSMKIASDIYAQLKSIGKLISNNDIYIASIAIENGLVLVSNNKKHFQNIVGLSLDNWL